LTFDNRPLDCERTRVEAPCDKQLAVHPEHCLDAPPLVSPKLTSKVRLIRFSNEFKQQFSGLALLGFPARRVGLFVSHMCGPTRDVAKQGTIALTSASSQMLRS